MTNTNTWDYLVTFMTPSGTGAAARRLPAPITSIAVVEALAAELAQEQGADRAVLTGYQLVAGPVAAGSAEEAVHAALDMIRDPEFRGHMDDGDLISELDTVLALAVGRTGDE